MIALLAAVRSPVPHAVVGLESDLRLIAALCPFVFVALWWAAGDWWLLQRRGVGEWRASALGACVGLVGTAATVAAVLRW